MLSNFENIVLTYLLMMLGLKARAHMLDKYFITEPHSQPLAFWVFFGFFFLSLGFNC